MPKATLADSTDVVEVEGYEGRFSEVGEYTAAMERYSADVDLAPLLRGLPDDRCQSPHWGYVLKGKLIYHFPDHDEVITTGEAYYIPPGHTPELTAETEVIEFSPTDELRRTMEVATKNAEASQG